MKDCDNHKILNPLTNRCVKKDGKIGKMIIASISLKRNSPKRNSPKRSSPKRSSPKRSSPKRNSPKRNSPKPCKEGKERNSITGRCRKIKNKKSVKPVGPGIPDNFNTIVEDCLKNAEWTTKNLLGEGEYGKAYIACKSDDCNYILKVQRANEDFYTEVEALTKLDGKNVSPKIFASWTCNGIGYYVMEKLFNCPVKPHKEIYTDVKKILDILKMNGWLHIDIHNGNIMCRENGKIVLIDFGWAVKKGKKNYPNHILSKENNKILTYNQLELLQDYNLEFGFGSDKELLNKLYGELIKFGM
jgi:predicted Ser/Thr protein kinase